MKKILRSPVTTAVLFVLAAGLLLTGTIGGVRAAELITTDKDYVAQLSLSNIALEMTESGYTIGSELLASVIPTNEEGEPEFMIGRVYPAAFGVANTGDIPEYIRVTVYKYWTEGSDDKRVDLDPALIEIEWDESTGWRIEEQTPERTVLYYTPGAVDPGDGTTAFTKSIMVSGDVYRAVSQAEKNGEYGYDYENLMFHIEAVADGVQDHNAEQAMTSAWGRTY